MTLFKTPSEAAPKPDAVVFEDFDVEFDPYTGWILLIYGKAGSGKTWFCGTADQSLYLNTGGGIDTLTSPLFKSKYPNIIRKKLDIFDTRQKYGFNLLTDAMDSFLDNKELKEQIRTVILDDASSLRTMAVNHGNESRNKKGFVETDGMNNARMEINRINWFLEYYIPILRNEGINFIMTAHEARIYGKARALSDDRPLKEIRPGFGGEKFVDYVPSKFDEVWYIEKQLGKNGEFTQFKTGGGGIELTKTRKNGVFALTEIGKDFEQLLKQRQENKLHPSFTR